MRFVLPATAAVAAAAVSTPAAAATIWFDTDHTAYSGDYATGQSLVFSGGGVNVRASAWTIDSGNDIDPAKLGVWSPGLGVNNGTGDNSHTIDNSGYRDFVLLQFDQVVELDNAQFRTGWHNMYDTDATIGFAMTALPFGAAPVLNGNPTTALNALGLTRYESGSWGNSYDSYRNINPGNNVGNLWLIGASFSNPEGAWKHDGFKLEKLTFEVRTPLPEPSTWLMMILGFGLVGATMRAQRRQKLTVSYG